MKQTPISSEREQYLLTTLRLTHDPFAYAVAESELHANEVDPPFFSYFVNPKSKQNQPLLEAIKEPDHAIIYGKVGSGKTTLRYALDAACRAVPDKTLVVSVEVGKDYTPPEIEGTPRVALLEALATDLFVQLLEQYYLLQDNLTPELVHQLGRFWQSSIPNFRRRLKRWLLQGQPEGFVGISRWWVVWHRAIVNYTPLTKERNTFLQTLLAIDEPGTLAEKDTLQEGISLAQMVGYKQIFVLVDVAGSVQVSQRPFQDQFHVLLENLLTAKFILPLYLKGFLPLEGEDFFEESLVRYRSLTSPFFSAIMEWKYPELLQAIIVNRFRSAGSLIKGFEAIASQKVVHHLNTNLIAAANGSPRRLLQLASLLITAHSQRDPTDPIITARDWQKMCQLWGFGPPNPAFLPTTTEPVGETS